MKSLSSQARLLLLSSFVTNIGSGIQSLALGRLLYDQTGSIAAFGGIIVLEYFVNFVTNILAGPLVDSVRAKKLALIVDCVRGVVICAVSLIIGIHYSIYWVMMITFAVQIGRPFYKSAMFRLQLEVVSEDMLTKMNGLLGSSFQAGQLIGIALTGVFIEQFSAAGALFINGVTFFMAAALIGLVRIQTPATEQEATAPKEANDYHKRVFGDWREVLTYLASNGLILFLVALSATDWVMASMTNVFLVPVVETNYDGSGYWLAALDGLFALGAILSGVMITKITDFLGLTKAALLGMLAQSLVFLTLSYSQSIYVVPVLMFAAGFSNTISWTAAITSLQSNVSKQFRGRVSLIRYMFGALFGAIAISTVTKVYQDFSFEAAAMSAAAVGFVFALIPLLVWKQEFSISLSETKAS